MKRLLPILFIFLVTTGYAQAGGMIIGSGAAGGCVDGTYAITEDFEGAGYEEAWTEACTNGTIDEDYTTDPGRGSQSLHIDYGSATGCYTRRAITTSGEIYYHLKVKTADTSAGIARPFVRLYSAMVEAQGNLQYSHTGTLTLQHGTNSVSTVGVVPDNTWVHVWVHWVKGSGADGVYSVGWSTTTTEPTTGDNYASGSNGTRTDDPGYLYLVVINGVVDYDQVYADTEALGTICD